MKRKRLILASQSPQRRKLLKKLKIPFEIVPSRASETHPSTVNARQARQLVIDMAHRKALAVAKKFKRDEAVILGADTLVVCKKKIFGKPVNEGHARNMLRALSSSWQDVLTGLCVITTPDMKIRKGYARTRLLFRPMDEKTIARLAKQNRDKSGSYSIQKMPDRFVKEMRGALDNVIGLPLKEVGQMLKKHFMILMAVWAIGMVSARAGVFEPGVEVIDAHAHIGHFKGYNLTLKNLLGNMKRYKVKAAVISNIDGAAIAGRSANGDERKINEETEKVAAAHPELKPLVWAKPGSPNSGAARIETFLRDSHFVGVKFHPDFNGFYANSSVVDPYLKLCEQYGVPAVFHCGKNLSDAKLIYEAARRFPNVPFILYHMGFGTDHSDAIEAARQAKLKGDAKLYLEISQADINSILKAIERAGANRVVFGTDATYFGKDHYRRYAPVLVRLKQTLSADDYKKIVHDNAAELFHLQ